MASPVILWFRQDLRLSDHPALAAAAAAGAVIPLFILDDETPGDWRWGGASRWWLHRSLDALSARIPLVLRRGRADTVLQTVVAETGATGLYFTRDYAPWSGALENRIKAICDGAGITCHRHGGFLLHEPESVKTGSGSFFKVYTPFARACRAEGEPRAPRGASSVTWATDLPRGERLSDWGHLPSQPNWARGFEEIWQPGEAGARARLANFIDDGLSGYADGRDRPDRQQTSRLSPHLHWGELSPHQVWHSVKLAMAAAEGRLDQDGEKFLNEVLWREFSIHLLHHVPTLPEAPFRPEFAAFPWREDAESLRRWHRGETGIPIVDAGLRELWVTGTMHNRVRMIAASFLIKHLLIPWQAGEAWFWDTLVDADLASNAASWQWVAGSGADAAPYFRIFNPVLQGEKFDPDGTYVRRFVPELAKVDAAFIHRPWEMALPPKAYPKPIVDLQAGRNRALAAFKSLSKDVSS
jgi:deoxyribodipyrimidine photo-lyase